MKPVVLFLFISLALIFLHEIAHIIAAKSFKLEIKGIGFALKPYPNVHVKIKWSNDKWATLFFLLAGNFLTISIFILAYLFTPFLQIKAVYLAFAFQVINEINPFYSDYLTARLMLVKNDNNKLATNDFKEKVKADMFSAYWYIHFIIWTFIIIFLLKGKL